MSADGQSLKRILMTADAVGGVWQYSVDLAAELTRHGVEVLLANLGPRPSKEQRNQLERTSGARLVEGDFALEWMHDPWQEIDQSKDWLRDHEQHFQPDVIHLNGYTLADTVFKAPVVSVAHSCVCSWWNAVHGCAAGAEWSEYRRRVAEGLHRSAAVVAPSGFMAESIVLHYGVEPAKISVISNFSLAPVSPVVEKQPYILAGGRMWDKAKNMALLESIAPSLNWPVYVAGNSEGKTSTTAIHYIGAICHLGLLEHMRQASIFVHPALYEPFGLAVLEAASSHCCLVLSGISSLRELWHGAATFVDPHDPEAWPHELNRLIADPTARERLANEAFSRAKCYQAESSTFQYLDVYRQAMKKQHADNGVAA